MAAKSEDPKKPKAAQGKQASMFPEKAVKGEYLNKIKKEEQRKTKEEELKKKNSKPVTGKLFSSSTDTSTKKNPSGKK